MLSCPYCGLSKTSAKDVKPKLLNGRFVIDTHCTVCGKDGVVLVTDDEFFGLQECARHEVKHTLPFCHIDREPQPGDIYVMNRHSFTADGHTWTIGDELKIVERTFQAPYGTLDPHGNFIIDAKNGKTVWSSIRWMIREHDLVRKEDLVLK